MKKTKRIGTLLTFFLVGQAVSASALVFDYVGAFTLCTSTCASFASLGGPGGSINPHPSDVIGAITIAATPGGSFTDADILGFSFAVSNSAVQAEAPVFDAEGILTNTTSTNPLPMDERVALITGFGNVNADGSFASGELILTFTASSPIFDVNDVAITFDLATGMGVGTLFSGAVLFAAIDGEFSLVPIPGAVWLLASALTVGFGAMRRRKRM